MAKALATKRSAREFERAMSGPRPVLNWAHPPQTAKLVHCIGCGCHDQAARWDEEAGQPCSWLAVDRSAGLGVCSACPDDQQRWIDGDREIAVPIDD